MSKYIADNGRTAEFDEEIPQAQVEQRLSWLPGKNWRKVE